MQKLGKSKTAMDVTDSKNPSDSRIPDSSDSWDQLSADTDSDRIVVG